MKRRFNIIILLCLAICLPFTVSACNITPNELESLSQNLTENEPTSHPHTFGAWQTLKELTENEEGLQERICSCGERETRVIRTAVGLAYTVNEDGESCTVTGMGTCTETALFIPAAIDGYRVIGIGESAFNKVGTLTHVTLPDSVVKLDKYAFFMCESLESITLSNNLESIGESAFFSCSSLTSLEIPATVKDVDILMIAGCKALKHLTVAEGNPIFYSEGNCVIAREDKTLVFGCNASVIPQGVTAIAAHAFRDAFQLETVVLPDSVTRIGEYAFSGCSAMTSIVLSSNIKAIENGVFYGCRSLASITIPEGVTSIGDNAFSNCEKLTAVTIPESVTRMGSCVFAMCIMLRGITFEGTVEQWNAISLGQDLIQTVFMFTVTCSDGTVRLN